MIEKLLEIVDFFWIVPSAHNLSGLPFDLPDYCGNTTLARLEKKLTVLDLSQNFRNSREIVKMTKLYAEKRIYHYEKGIAMVDSLFSI